MTLTIRTYKPADWASLERVHDRSRVHELQLAGLEEAFLPLEIVAKREHLLEYPGLYVAETDKKIVGFAACSEEELAWLYVDPAHTRKGIGRRLSEHALQHFPGIRCIEVLKGNEPARKLYESLGFAVVTTETGQMPGNEAFTVEVYSMAKG